MFPSGTVVAVRIEAEEVDVKMDDGAMITATWPAHLCQGLRIGQRTIVRPIIGYAGYSYTL